MASSISWARWGPAASGRRAASKKGPIASTGIRREFYRQAESFCPSPKKDCSFARPGAPELLYAAGLRVSELHRPQSCDMEQKERILRSAARAAKERIVPYGAKAQEALEKYASARTAPGADVSAMQAGAARRSGLPQLFPAAPYPALRRAHRQEITFASTTATGTCIQAFVASRVRDASARRRC